MLEDNKKPSNNKSIKSFNFLLGSKKPKTKKIESLLEGVKKRKTESLPESSKKPDTKKSKMKPEISRNKQKDSRNRL